MVLYLFTPFKGECLRGKFLFSDLYLFRFMTFNPSKDPFDVITLQNGGLYNGFVSSSSSSNFLDPLIITPVNLKDFYFYPYLMFFFFF